MRLGKRGKGAHNSRFFHPSMIMEITQIASVAAVCDIAFLPMTPIPLRPPLVSCGVLAFEPEGSLLLCHLTRTPWWDIPKGLQEAGESQAAAAAREAWEECGLRLDPSAWIALGRFLYRTGKDLCLFSVLIPHISPADLRCTSSFTDRHGVVRPEVDGYAWVRPAELGERCAPALARVLLEKVNLDDVFGRVTRLAARHDGWS
jgi:8-oxo-dGTP pyrophosphatase MutT (NUDIX family)